MSIELVFTPPQFRRVLAQLTARSTHLVSCAADHIQHARRLQYLVRSVAGEPPVAANANRLIVTAHSHAPNTTTLIEPLAHAATVAHLALGIDTLAGQAWAVARELTAPEPAPLGRVLLAGSGWLELQVSQPGQLLSPSRAALSPDQLERWSRTIGAVGLPAWRRLTALKIALIGCGRTGSHVATTLMQMGVRALTLIDADRIERHNLGEMIGVTSADLGRPKAEALADFLYRQSSGSGRQLSVEIHLAPIVRAYRAAWEADVIVATVDNDAARLAASLLATLGHKVLIDIGTGLSPTAESSAANDDASIAMSADVRLIVPGHGCLVCFGHLANYETALAALRNRDALPEQQPWWEQRRGSSLLLNMQAASLGLQLLLDLIAGRRQASAWLQLRFDERGQPTIESRTYSAPVRTDCSVCRRAGMGELGLAW